MKTSLAFVCLGFALVLSAGSKRQVLYSAGYSDEGGWE
jgi:hypothetical protein